MGVYALTFTSLCFAYDCLMSFTDLGGFPGDTVERIPLPRQEAQETRVQFLGWEDPLGEERATAPVFLLGESPWTERPGGLQSMGLQRDRHD